MTKRSIPRALRRRVLARSHGQCEYCHTLTAITGAKPVIDHILPESADGRTEFDNLCAACHSCNEFKAARREAPDPHTNNVVALFHPRLQRWLDHFRWTPDGTQIRGRTPTGRATVAALKMNHQFIVEARRRWVTVGWHPPIEDRA